MGTERVAPRGELGRVRFAGVVAIALVVVISFVGASALVGASSGRTLATTARPSDLNCNGGAWNTTHLAVFASGCQALFTVEYAQNFSEWNATNQYNFSFALPWVVEVTPQGQLVRAASPLNPFYSHTSVTGDPENVNVTMIETMNVTNGSGTWTPSDVWAGGGPGWNISSVPVGASTIIVMFHLVNAGTGNTSQRTGQNLSMAAEFTVTLVGWPWVSASDSLGFALSALSAWGAHFSYNATGHTLSQIWNSTGVTYASLVFGTSATATYPPSGSTASATASEQVGIFSLGVPSRSAMALVTFGGVEGNYSSMSYDPWVVFAPSGVIIPPVLVPPKANTSWFTPLLLLLLSVVAAVAACSLIAAVVARNVRLHREGEDLVRGMQEAIAGRPKPPTGGR